MRTPLSLMATALVALSACGEDPPAKDPSSVNTKDSDSKSGDKEATLYEVVTRGTVEEFTSNRRRQHSAYGGD